MFKIDTVAGFYWINPMNFNLESYCLTGEVFNTCAGSLIPLINKQLGLAVDVKKDTGDLFGFLVPRKDNTIIFKTLDRKSTTKVLGAVGSDCSVASDLGGHRGRIRDTQITIRNSLPDLAKYLLEDEDTAEARHEKGKATRAESLKFKHIDDFSHIYVCMYLETLLRILDNEECLDKRWFLNAVDASRAGLKGRP